MKPVSAHGTAHNRIIFDVSTTIHWVGPPVGIVRVEHELATWARHDVEGVRFSWFDPTQLKFLELPFKTVDGFLAGESSLDTLGLSDPTRRGRHRTDRIPAAIRPAFMWVLQFRRKLVQALERIRLHTKSQPIAAFVERLQRPLITEKYRNSMFRPDGVRRAHITPDMLDGTAFAFTPNDVLVCAGAGWAHHNIDVVHRLKQTTGVRVVILCYDIIPLLHPHFYRSHDVEAFRDYFRRAFPLADLVIFTSRKVEADVRSYCHLHGIALGSTLVSPVGANACTIPSTPVNLPEGLKQERYILLVSTIEPRKGHRMIYGIWCRLLREGIPQQADYKLVFVGRRGWMVDDLIRQITENSHVANSLVVLNDVDDAALAVLYRGAAFALYPSLYEGFGLPVVEAFFHGKAILASSGGALPEAVGEFSPCLDPKDAELWYRTLKRWIVDPAARAPFEALIRSGFRHPTWSEAAQAFFTAIDRSLPAKPDWHARQSELDRPTMRR